MKITAEVRTVTPENAQAWLALSRGNRRIRESRVEQYAKSMREGAFALNGETIILGGPADAEVLLDGHHRLMAIERSGVAIRSIVVRGIDPATWDTVDTGIARSASDDLTIAGVSNASWKAAALRVEIAYRRGMMTNRHEGAATHGREATISTTDVRRFYESEQMFVDGMDKMGSMASRSQLAALAPWATAWFWLAGHLFNDHGEGEVWEKFQQFVEQCQTGIGLEKGAPTLALRQKRLGAYSAKISAVEQRALVVKAWNAHFRGDRFNAIRWQASETFPEVLPAGKHQQGSEAKA